MAEKKSIVVACEDENWMENAEGAFIDVFAYEDLHFITDPEFLRAYFSVPRKHAALMIDEALYNDSFARHNIEHTFILAEDSPTTSLSEISNYLSKYDSLKSITKKVKAAIGSEGPEEASLVYIYSPVGGAGTTSCALGAAIALANDGKRVLLVNTGSLQDFAGETGVGMRLDEYALAALKAGGDACYNALKPYIVKSSAAELLFVLPPSQFILMSKDISEADFLTFAVQAKASKEYDVIIVSGDSAFTRDKPNFMSAANKVALIVDQRPDSAFRFSSFLAVIVPDPDRYIYVANGYHANRDNALLGFPALSPLDFIKIPYNGEKASGKIPYGNPDGLYDELALSLL